MTTKARRPAAHTQDPTAAKILARLGALSLWRPDDPEIPALRAALQIRSLEERLRYDIASIDPPMTAEQRQHLADVLTGRVA